MKGLRYVLCLCGSLLVCACVVRAQQALPLAAAGPEATGADPLSVPRLSGVSMARLVSFDVALNGYSSVSVSTELLSLATPHVKVLGAQEKPDWRFKGLPLTVAYNRTWHRARQQVTPVATVGASVYFCNTRQRMRYAAAEGPGPFAQAYGVGYGLHAALGVRAPLGRHLYLQAQGRYRYVNGQALTTTAASGAAFPLFDFVMGVGVTL